MESLRNISAPIERLLWGVSAGRCEFEGCNKPLYRHEVTDSNDNYAEKAHIHAVNKGGARYDENIKEFRNDFNNLMLVCPQCHIAIDRDKTTYTAERLYEMKAKHEQRIYTLTNIGTDLQSHMVYYTANIAGSHLSVNDGDARNALTAFGKYPSEDSPIDLSVKGSYLEDNEADYYTSNASNLKRAVQSRILDTITKGANISLFALAPQPLLMYLGNLLNDKYNVNVFQCYRRSQNKWTWQEDKVHIEFITDLPEHTSYTAKIALAFSLSSSIEKNRIQAVLGEDASIYSITIATPNREFVTAPTVMDRFIYTTREVIETIKQRHGKDIEVHVFPAMPASLAVRFGMDYMTKTDNPLIIYDEAQEHGFVFALKIGG